MDDITVRLRRGFGGMVPPVCDEAANEIDRLRLEIKSILTGQLTGQNTAARQEEAKHG